MNLLPEDAAANISQLIELDLLADKDKKKNDDDSDEEVTKKWFYLRLFSLSLGFNVVKNGLVATGGGGAGRRARPGGEEVEQENSADASRPAGTKHAAPVRNRFLSSTLTNKIFLSIMACYGHSR